jgi:hypothetical protein
MGNCPWLERDCARNDDAMTAVPAFLCATSIRTAGASDKSDALLSNPDTHCKNNIRMRLIINNPPEPSNTSTSSRRASAIEQAQGDSSSRNDLSGPVEPVATPAGDKSM